MVAALGTMLSFDEVYGHKATLVGSEVFFTTAHFQFAGKIDDVVRAESIIHIVIGDIKHRKTFSGEEWRKWWSDAICVSAREGVDGFWSINNGSKIYVAFRNVNSLMIKTKRKR